MTETRVDAFLGGRLNIRQPIDGYRAGADPVFLAAAVPAQPGESVLELGTGVGTALLCLMARVSNLRAVGLEREEQFVELARENCAANGQSAEILVGDVARPPAELTERSFDHVFFNPPYFNRNRGSQSPNPRREAGRGGCDEISLWCDCALKRLRPGGALTFINRAEHVPESLAALGNRAGDITLRPLAPRAHKSPKLFILRAKKGSRAPFRMLPPLVLHEGETHVRDGDSYTESAREILRFGAAMPWET